MGRKTGHDLRKLIDDRRFLEYHKKTLKRREFNAFDVLRYSDYEIRHSNVLAWLLQPDGTHRLGRQFLKWFVDHHNELAKGRGIEAAINPDFNAAGVRVERELDYVDISVFLEKQMLAIENKTVEASSEHFDQVRAYEEKLSKKHGQKYTVRSVLLTTSREGTVSPPGFVHVSWSSVVKKIRTLHAGGAFRTPEVSAFIRQYLDAVGRWLVPAEASVGHFTALRGDYGSLLKEMLNVLAQEGDAGLARMVPTQGSEFRRTLVQLAKEFRREPKNLRTAVGDFLKRRKKLKTIPSQSRDKTEYWLYWESLESARELGIDSCLRWGMGFGYWGVTIGFYLFLSSEKMQSALDRIKERIRQTPINRQNPDSYPMKEGGSYFWVYLQELLSEEDLADMTTSRAKDVVLEKLTAFLDSDESEHRRIEDYFKGLAFRPDVPALGGEEAK